MNPETKQMKNSSPLSYSLRERVRCLDRDGSPVLVLDFPLKSIVLNPFWGPVLSRLTTVEFVPINRIMTLVDGVDAEQTE
ncbi:hypothetical protein ACFL1Z_06175 [Thermodesulfobacteriota bacterium]